MSNSTYRNNNNINKTDEFALDSPLSQLTLYLIGIYLVIVFVACVALNATLLLIFLRHKKLRNRLNMLVFIITLLNLMASVQFPFVIHSAFEQRYLKY